MYAGRPNDLDFPSDYFACAYYVLPGVSSLVCSDNLHNRNAPTEVMYRYFATYIIIVNLNTNLNVKYGFITSFLLLQVFGVHRTKA